MIKRSPRGHRKQAVRLASRIRMQLETFMLKQHHLLGVRLEEPEARKLFASLPSVPRIMQNNGWRL